MGEHVSLLGTPPQKVYIASTFGTAVVGTVKLVTLLFLCSVCLAFLC